MVLNEECRQGRAHLTGRVTLASVELMELLPRRAAGLLREAENGRKIFCADDSIVFDRSPLVAFNPPELDENGERALKEADIAIEVNNFEEPHVSWREKKTKQPNATLQHYKIMATLNSCRCDIDYSFVDRLYDFLEALSTSTSDGI